ncbi:hypothetical protein ACIA8C_37055 [Nocardia sp. NPDC051321]|uniref:hypothetical protein n=1 Tax=Nocardia sp. NPDC051321 TaxID=3364323 RepID=UPI0037BBAA26
MFASVMAVAALVAGGSGVASADDPFNGAGRVVSAEISGKTVKVGVDYSCEKDSGVKGVEVEIASKRDKNLIGKASGLTCDSKPHHVDVPVAQPKQKPLAKSEEVYIWLYPLDAEGEQLGVFNDDPLYGDQATLT